MSALTNPASMRWEPHMPIYRFLIRFRDGTRAEAYINQAADQEEAWANLDYALTVNGWGDQIAEVTANGTSDEIPFDAADNDLGNGLEVYIHYLTA